MTDWREDLQNKGREALLRDLHEARERADRLARALTSVRRALDDELANLADDGARLSHSVVRRIEACLAAPSATDPGSTR